MARPIIALITDFGLCDHYVGALKSVMLGICRDATFIDISHEIAPQDILAGALQLEAVSRFLPANTVVIGVVDPGVGSSRRGVAIEASGVRFVGPDNGLFSLAWGAPPPDRAFEITNPDYMLRSISRTFEGRDRFAPAAAWLARGDVDLSQLGPAVDGLTVLDVPRPILVDDGLDGVVLRVDRFGNAITNIRQHDLEELQHEAVVVAAGGATIDGVSRSYADVPSGALCALVGSTGRLEISVNGGSARDTLGVSTGAAVRVRRRSGA
jgi:S-adenosylmethionine hydrolase